MSEASSAISWAIESTEYPLAKDHTNKSNDTESYPADRAHDENAEKHE
jgi:hypothetical protein